MSRTTSAGRAHIFRFGVYEFDSGTGQLRKGGLRVHLAAQGQQALQLLLEKAGQPVSREELHRLLWPDQPHGEHDHSLNNILNRTREALRDDADNPRFIRTLPRVGYVFLAPVREERATLVAGIPPPVRTAWLRSALLILSAALCGFLVWFALRGQNAEPVAPDMQAVRAVPLTGAAGYESTPSFAPDGVRLAFSWEMNGNRHIYKTSIEGASPSQLTVGAAHDSGPVWSPDGASIAFVRRTSRQSADVYVVAANGGVPRKLLQVQRGHSEAPLAWTGDSQSLVWGDISSDGEPWRLKLISAHTGAIRDLTEPADFRGDAAPAVSPDGTRIAFARYTAASSSDIFVADFHEHSVARPRRLTALQREVEAIVWTPDGRHLIFSAGGVPRDTRTLYRVSVDGGGGVRELSPVRIEGCYPAVSGTGALVFSRPNAGRVAIWSLDLPAPGSPHGTLSRILISSARDLYPDLSPDGRRITFCSTRSGHPEIWVAAADGSGARKLASFGEAGATCPRWSPDGSRIAFEGRFGGQSDVYVAEVATGAVQRITTDPGNDLLPAWSADSATIYFMSRRSGSPQIWAVPAKTGAIATQVTRSGGFHPVGAREPRVLYYTGADMNPWLITRLSLATGRQDRLLQDFRGVWSLAPSKDGLFYLEQAPLSPRNAIRYRSFSAGSDVKLADIPGVVHDGLSASQDGRRVIFSMEESREASLVMLKNFR